MLLQAGTPGEVGMSASRLQGVIQRAEGWVAQGITSALVLLVARRGVIVLHQAFGRLTSDSDASPVQLDTIYPITSLTKPITATAVMALVEDGLLSLQRPVSDYIAEFVGEGKQAVMVHHLLTHTSGLRDEDVLAHAMKKKDSVSVPRAEETQHPWINESLWLRYDAPLWRAPGVEMCYSNFGYNLLGEIVRRVGGQSLAKLARDRIFEPLGMKDTFYAVPESVRHRIVRRPADAPYAVGVVGPGLGTREHEELPWASGGVYSTAVDMATFAQMFLSRGSYGDARILSPASVSEMTRNQIPGIGSRFGDEFFPEASWGLGWGIRGDKKALRYGSLHSPQTFSHQGAGGAFFWVDPVYDLVGVYFSVVLEMIDSLRSKTGFDLFMNAVTAAVVEA